MKIKQHIPIVLITFFSSLIVFVLFTFVFFRTNEFELKSEPIIQSAKRTVVLTDFRISEIEKDKLSEQFPTEQVLQKFDYSTPENINTLLEFTDTTIKNSFAAQELLSTVFTTELNKSLKPQSLDSIYSILCWAKAIKAYSATSKQYQDFNIAVADYWMNYIANTLSSISKEHKSVKYTFKFRYLRQVCIENSYLTDNGNSNFEKTIFYILDSKWNYLFNRFWFSTSFIFKSFLIIAICIMIGVLLVGLITIIKSIKNGKKN